MDTLVASHHVTTRIDRNVMSEFGNRLVRVNLSVESSSAVDVDKISARSR